MTFVVMIGKGQCGVGLAELSEFGRVVALGLRRKRGGKCQKEEKGSDAAAPGAESSAHFSPRFVDPNFEPIECCRP
jgi:hypothetical protein